MSCPNFYVIKKLCIFANVMDTPTMNDYYQVDFSMAPANVDACDYLASELADAGFESFVSNDDAPGSTLQAFVPAPLYSAAAVDDAVASLPFDVKVGYAATFVPGQDWNSEWEKHYFQPIVIGGKAVVHSSFHTNIPQAQYDIVIDPRMAFGTGHHATTTLMMTYLLENNIEGLTVVDMGTGTGILAILAAMRGAARVVAVEIDKAAYDNAVENVACNLASNARSVDVRHGDAQAIADVEEAQLFLANINRNIITADIAAYARSLAEGAHLLVSGFYVADRPIVEEAASRAGLQLVGVAEIDNWSSMTFIKK